MFDRIISFNNDDWKHISFLCKIIIKGLLTSNTKDAVDGWWFLKIHLFYDSKRIK
jgi:hypothetical protein